MLRLIAVVLVASACQRETAPADCGALADRLAKIELAGAGATPPPFATVVARHRAACEAAKVTPSEAACLGRARDTWSAVSCVPRMFPRTPAATAECAEVVARVKQTVEREVARLGSDGQALMAKMLPAMQQSCELDGWPPALRACIVAVQPGDMAAMQRCTESMSPELHAKLQQRMAQAAPR